MFNSNTDFNTKLTEYILNNGCREVADLKDCEKCKESGIALMTFDSTNKDNPGPNYHVAGYNTCGNGSWYGRPSPGTPYYYGIPSENYNPDKDVGGRDDVRNYKRRNFCCKRK